MTAAAFSLVQTLTRFIIGGVARGCVTNLQPHDCASAWLSSIVLLKDTKPTSESNANNIPTFELVEVFF